MTDDSRFICRYGFHHVVVTLAEECSGVTHGMGDQHQTREAPEGLAQPQSSDEG